MTARPLILGISVFGHDSSCALVAADSGTILYALTEERFSNKKHDGAFPTAALTTLREKITRDQLGTIHTIALNLDPTLSLEPIHQTIAQLLDPKLATQLSQEFSRFLDSAEILHPDYFPLNYLQALLTRNNVAPTTTDTILGKMRWYGNFALRHRQLKSRLQTLFPDAQIIPVAHHLCHAASAFYCSGFDSAAILTIDGQGETATITLNQAQAKTITLLEQTHWPHSLGALYMQLAWYLGFDGDDPRYPGFGDEFKVMGMAAYGQPTYLETFRKLGRVNEHGQFEFTFNDYIALQPVIGCAGHTQPVLAAKFFETLGPRRERHDPIEQKHYDIAKSGQAFLEEIAVTIAKNLKQRCPNETNLCIAGGVGLNGLMNMRILEEAGFKNIFIQPASGDDGTSLGAALHIYHSQFTGPRSTKMQNAFLGLSYDDNEIREALAHYNLKFTTPDSIHAAIAQHLNAGHIVARYTGRGEFGPRALGHRSILANPTLPTTKDDVNARIKHRESFRPFAPACLEAHVADYFDITAEAPYMLLICQAKPGIAAKIPAVVHDDNTARLQILRESENPDFHQTLAAFYALTGTPVLLNTSFNVNGEAIVETPLDAIESFLFMGIDYLAIGPYLVAYAENAAQYNRPLREAHIAARQARYHERYFSAEQFLWPTTNPLETEFSLLKQQSALYKQAADERLQLIERLDAQLKRAAQTPTNTTIMTKVKRWVQ